MQCSRNTYNNMQHSLNNTVQVNRHSQVAEVLTAVMLKVQDFWDVPL